VTMLDGAYVQRLSAFAGLLRVVMRRHGPACGRSLQAMSIIESAAKAATTDSVQDVLDFLVTEEPSA